MEIIIISLISLIAVGVYKYAIHPQNKKIKTIRTELSNLIKILEDDNEENKEIELIQKADKFKEVFKIYFKNKESDKREIDEIFKDHILEKNLNLDFLNFSPMIYTALGILGTFIGLAVGVSGLKTTGSISEIKGSITILTEGISTAFITSIGGVAVSIILNIRNKITINKMYSLKNEFIDKFNLIFANKNKHHLENEMYQMQKEQTKCLKTLAEDLGTKFADEISKQIIPSLDKMREAVVNTQADGMQDLVNNFVENLNGSLNDRFEQLSESINDMITWQKEVKNEMDNLIVEIENSGQNQLELNKTTEELIKLQGETNKSFEKANEKFNESFDKISKIFGDLNGFLRATGEINKQIKMNSDNVYGSIKTFEKIVNKMDGNINMIVNDLQKLNDTFNTSSENFSNSLNKSLINTFDVFDDKLSKISTQLASTISDLNDVLIDVPDSVDSIPNTLVNIERSFENINQNILELQSIDKRSDS